MKRRAATAVAARTTTGASTPIDRPRGASAFEVAGQTSSGAGSATVKLQGTNDKLKTVWNDVVTVVITLSSTRSSQEASLRASPCYRFYRTNTTAISGTGAAVDAFMGTK